MSKKKEKAFDAVKMMWDIREKISSETQGMTLEQLKRYIADRTGKKSALAVKK